MTRLLDAAATFPRLNFLVLGCIAALRLGELIFSAWRLRIERRAAGADAPTAAVAERVYPWMVLAHAGWYAGCVLEGWLAPAAYAHVAGGSWVVWSAAAAWGASLGLRVWLWASLGRWWSVRIVARAHQPIVTHGPYAWVRHPNYVAVILEIAAVPLLLGAPWTALVGSTANGVVLAFRIRREETYLFAQPGYRAVFAGKRRFIPGLF
jgi:methyltransferase